MERQLSHNPVQVEAKVFVKAHRVLYLEESLFVYWVTGQEYLSIFWQLTELLIESLQLCLFNKWFAYGFRVASLHLVLDSLRLGIEILADFFINCGLILFNLVKAIALFFELPDSVLKDSQVWVGFIFQGSQLADYLFQDTIDLDWNGCVSHVVKCKCQTERIECTLQTFGKGTRMLVWHVKLGTTFFLLGRFSENFVFLLLDILVKYSLEEDSGKLIRNVVSLISAGFQIYKTNLVWLVIISNSAEFLPSSILATVEIFLFEILPGVIGW